MDLKLRDLLTADIASPEPGAACGGRVLTTPNPCSCTEAATEQCESTDECGVCTGSATVVDPTSGCREQRAVRVDGDGTHPVLDTTRLAAELQRRLEDDSPESASSRV